jgi:hypothetical protein
MGKNDIMAKKRKMNKYKYKPPKRGENGKKMG